MFINNDDVFAYYDESGNLLCVECASAQLDLDTIKSSQIVTKDEAAKNEGFYFCDVHPTDDNQIF